MPSTSFRRATTAAAVTVAAVLSAMPSAPVQAAEYNSIFPAGWDNNMRSRMFMRIGYVSTFTRTKSEEARDITGFAVSRADAFNAFKTAKQITADCDSGTLTGADCTRYNDNASGTRWDLAQSVLESAFTDTGLAGIGTPPGIKARAQKQVGTPALSLGYWLDEERKWLIEGFVLASPMSIKIYGDGVRSDGTPNSVNGKHLATTKLLPPLVIGSYNFGDRNDVVRPYVGVGAMYAVFFNGKSTDFFNDYQGGKTTVSTRNTFGAGPFVGLQSSINDDWHVNVSVGQIGLRTTSRLVTSNTVIRTGDAVISDLQPRIIEAINAGEDMAADIGTGLNGVTTMLTELVARNKGQANLGTYVREQKMKITNTIVNISVGRSF